MSFRVDTSALKEIADSLNDPQIEQRLRTIASDKGIVAIIADAVKDNFDKEGPGWKPLKARTIKTSVSKAIRKNLKGMTEEQILAYEEKVRGDNPEGLVAFRRILRLTGLLFRTATTPGYRGSASGAMPGVANRNGVGKKVAAGSNIYRVEGTNIIYGTDLVYAKTHNQGDPKRNIDARPFLVIRPEWMKDINEFWTMKAQEIIRSVKGIKS